MQIHWHQKLSGAKEAEYRCQAGQGNPARRPQASAVGLPVRPDPNVAFGGNPHGPLAQYVLYEHDERTFRPSPKSSSGLEVPVQLRERNLEPSRSSAVTQFVGHNTQGAALYQNEKGVRYKFDGEVGWNEPVKIAYTEAGVQGEIDRRYHPEYMTIEEIVAQDQQEHRAAPAAPAAPAPPAAEPPQPDDTTASIAEQRQAAFGHWGWEQAYSDFFLT